MQLLRIKKFLMIGLALVTASGLLLLSESPPESLAAVAPAPSPGNIFSDSLTVGGQTVDFYYTEHIQPNGTLKVRFDAGTYSTGTLISHMIHDLPAFDSWGEYASPFAGAIVLPDEDINPTQTAYERLDSDGCAGCYVDQVLTVTFSGLAAGSYTFDLSVFHNGALGTRNNLVFYVDAGAPTATDESEIWVALPGMDSPCADGIDNDLNFYTDCADTNCVGQVGRVGDGALCESPESTCYDGFDNDNDGVVDCLDSDCDGLVGRTFDGALCQYENERGLTSCADNFDNDGDDLMDCSDNIETVAGQSCWKTAGSGCPLVEDCDTPEDDDKDQSYSDDWDAEIGTGVNCQDYDCAGHASCPTEEHRAADGSDADRQCFNGDDDDLDGLFDCGDPDCVGMDKGGVNPNMCFESEFSLVNRYMLCNNNFNDDADVPFDCEDADCKQVFESCGPCPAREDLNYSACADGEDNDLDGLNDCADTDCTDPGTMANPSLGYLDDAARCATAENDDPLCSDGWDNDADALTDCADDQCLGRQVGLADIDLDGIPEAAVQCEAVETSCGDFHDNDGDGFIDCVDSDCWGVGFCAPAWATAACQEVPRLGPFVAFAAVTPTVTGAVTVANHVNATDTIRLVGSGEYASIAIVIGDNTDDAAVYPYADPTCTLTGNGSAQMSFVQVAGRVAHIFNAAGQTLNGFDLTFSCPTSASPETWRSFPISISVLRSPGDVPESGDQVFNYILYEDIDPLTTEVEVEGQDSLGAVSVPRGSERRFRVVANDPGAGLFTSGICSCTIEVEGTEHDSTDGNCVTEPVSGAWFDDGTIDVRYHAEDGVNNISNYTPIETVNVNVTPRMISPELTVRPTGIPIGWESSPFFRSDRLDMNLEVSFETANSDSFLLPECNAVIRNPAGNVVAGLPPTVPLPMFGDNAVPNRIHCLDSVTIPAGLSDGEYFVTVMVTDSDGDSIESNRQVIYICNNKPRPGEPENECSWADFDGDAAAEGLYNDVYAADFKACDNCVNLYNPFQQDRNANGVGEICEPSVELGRCEFDREIVCEYDSDDPFCTPTPPIGSNCCPPEEGTGNPQQCVGEGTEFWGLCLHDFYVCFDDAECGWCEDGGVQTSTGCSDDEDCTLAGLSGPCLSGDGYCADEPTQACRRDIDCEGAGFVGPCLESNLCDELIFPWLETLHGDVFSQKKILAPVENPENSFNATYCITAEGSIMYFESELCELRPNANTGYERPKPENYYATVLGQIDVPGLLAGKYGQVHESTPAGFDGDFASLLPLDGRVIVVNAAGADVPVTYKNITNAALSGYGNGTVVINGGNLIINGNMEYQDAPVTKLRNLASLGWVILPQPDGTAGNVIVDGNVLQVVGSFLIAGEEGIDTVGPPLEGSEKPFTLYGLVIARKLILDRTLRSPDIGSERFIYDGRAVANPPPGFADVTRSLPVITDYPQ